MSSDDRQTTFARVECAKCGTIAGGRLLFDVALPSADGPDGRFRCPACGHVNSVPRP
ncbi:hypothetical protein NDI76_16935 [Halogeometricum sp. S1BR25-6]|uniref:Small CPxCG-related zinc finger protein n=1 Tax=Halogeometricum salsisoli TaxID=2950536 RepID=A0ABU2GHX8_9EURY|nr:hypothetical protein [Halogeometricum sp. S1BR25-6]MDS0300435.1 hypothetical protein [Halogeometricum sp. S1BR25-6]